ncbi:MAG: DUF3047 domain-containing protein [Candidatus Binatia bacterium]
MSDARLYEVEATDLPWSDTGLELEEGEWVTTIACGRVVLSDALDVWIGPQFQLWMRVGDSAAIFNGTRDTTSFRCESRGRFYLANNFPGQWGDPGGRVSTSLEEYGKYTGGMTVVVVRWKGPAVDGLAALAPAAGGRLADEHQRLVDDVQTPPGWRYLWFLGRSEIFRSSTEDGQPCISCHTHRNVGILQHDAAFELTQTTRLRWSWKVDELPSTLPENTALSHDYLSVAVEFENGRDITYTWSPELPVGTGYWCPLATWKDREFHVVIRCGNKGLGTWLKEERNLHQDYLHYIGDPPARVVRVWLIAVSLFQRRNGRASFREFELEGGEGRGRLQLT